jgi:hypothetical protein
MKDGLDPYGSETEAALAYFEMDQLQDHGPIPQRLADLAAALGGPLAELLVPDPSGVARTGVSVIVSKILKLASQKEKLNLTDMLYYVANDLNRLGKQVDELKKNDRSKRLFLQAGMEARTASSEDCVKRLAAVVVSGILRPTDPEDLVAEFLRMTSTLTETDVLVLRTLSNYQEELLVSDTGDDSNKRRTKLHQEWSQLLESLRSKDIFEMSSRAALVRLQSLGLVEPITGGFDAVTPRYEVLELGIRYLEYLIDEDDDSVRSKGE